MSESYSARTFVRLLSRWGAVQGVACTFEDARGAPGPQGTLFGSSAEGGAIVQQWGSLNPEYSNIGAGRFVNPQWEQVPSTDTFYLPAVKGTGGLSMVVPA